MAEEDGPARPFGWLPIVLIVPATLYVLYWYGRLPASVPVHFDAAGHANGYGHKSALLFLPLLGLALERLLAFFSGHPEWANFPVQVTDDNRSRLYAVYYRFMLFMRVMLTALFAAMAVMSVEAARGGGSMPLPWALFVYLGVFWAGIAAYLVQMVRAR